MSGSSQFIPTNVFGTQSGTIPLSLLDTNFNQIAAFLNNPNNYTNYLVDSGSTNTYVVTFPTGEIPVSYSAGLGIAVKLLNTNTGTSTLNVNGLGAISIRVGTSAITSGQLVAGTIALFVYDGTYFQLMSGAGSGSGAVAGGVMYENYTTLTGNYTLTTGKNAMMAGPLTINTGVVLTIPTGQRLVVL